MLPAFLKITSKFLPGIYLGWSLGSNDAANVFGPQVNSGIIRYRNAVILSAILIALGAVTEGQRGFSTIGGLSALALLTAIISTLSAALIVSTMSYLGLPVSATQAVVGAIIGMGLLTDSGKVEWPNVWKMVFCWNHWSYNKGIVRGCIADWYTTSSTEKRQMGFDITLQKQEYRKGFQKSC